MRGGCLSSLKEGMRFLRVWEQQQVEKMGTVKEEISIKNTIKRLKEEKRLLLEQKPDPEIKEQIEKIEGDIEEQEMLLKKEGSIRTKILNLFMPKT